MELYELANREIHLRNTSGKLNFHDAYKAYKRESYTMSTPYSSSELYIKKYFDRNNIQGLKYDENFNNDLFQFSISCVDKVTTQGSKVNNFLQIITEPLFKNIINEAKSEFHNAEYKLDKNYQDKTFKEINQSLLLKEKEIDDLLAKSEQYDNLIAEAFWKGWPHTLEYIETQEKLSSATNQGTIEYLILKQRYEELDTLSNQAWADSDNLPAVKKLNEQKEKENKLLNSKNIDIRDLRKYHSALIKLNSIRTMMKKRDASALGDYLNIIDCENTIIGNI